MTDTQAEVSEVTDEPEQAVSDEPEVEAETEVVEEEKADATPTMLQLNAKLDIIQNMLEQFLPSKDKDPKKFDYPEEDVKVLQDSYGEENTLHLLTILGDNYTRLLDKAEEEPAEEAKVEAEPEAEAEPEVEAETVEEEKVEETVEETAEAPEAEEPTVEETTKDEPAEKSQIIDDIQVAMEAKLKELDTVIESVEKYAKVQKRSPGPKAEGPRKSLLEVVGKIPWGKALDELAQEGA